MQFIPNGCDIPDALLRSHAEGRLVFFCGAGISYRAGLKDFAWLTQELYARTYTEPDAVQTRALKEKRYDTAIQLLEADGDIRDEFRRERVRACLPEILCPDTNLSGYADTHAALLTLAGDMDDPNRIRLVTTNFDRVFEIVRIRDGLRSSHYAAPFLPPPDNRWTGLVYLHGLLPESPTKKDLENLVISSGDFGKAYLTERWASRFVGELFRRYDICFVGYSLEDPVLRYITDALAADRWQGEIRPAIYAFAAVTHGQGSGLDVANDWKAKGVVPILYDAADKHAVLHDTLTAWANCHRDGLEGKIAIINRYAGINPTECIPTDDFVGRVIWALSDPSGKPARHFANRPETPPLTWLEAMEARDLAGLRKESGKTSPDSIFRRPPTAAMAASLRISHAGGTSHLPFDAVGSALGHWLIRHLDNPELLIRVAEHGGNIHPDWAASAEWQLRELRKQKQSAETSEEAESPKSLEKIRPVMEKLWRLVLAGKLTKQHQRFDLHDWFDEFSHSGLTPILKWRLRELLAPHFTLRRPWRFYETPESPDAISPNDLFSLEIVLGTDFVSDAIRSQRKGHAWQIALPLLIDEFTRLLDDCCDLMTLLGMANSYKVKWEVASIEESSQNQHSDDWTTLVFLLRDAWERVHEEEPSRAVSIAKLWWEKPFPLFKRLVFHAATISPSVMPETILNWFASDDACWLWTADCLHERIRLLETIPARWDALELERLESLLLAEPARGLFPPHLQEENLRNHIDSVRRSNLISLQTGGAKLGEKSRKFLADILLRHPELKRALSDSEKFRIYHPSPDKRARWISKRKETMQERLRAFLSRQAEDSRIQRAWNRWGERLLRDEFFADEIISETALALRQVAKNATGKESLLQEICFRILNTQEPQQQSWDDMLMAAINSAKGRATEALLIQWGQTNPEKNQGIPEYLRKRFTSMTVPGLSQFQEARCILCSRLVFLFQVDPEWTTQHLIPLFDWSVSESEAKVAWEGFLWSPRLYRPLLKKMAATFLETANHYDKISEGLREMYAELLTYAALDRRDVFTEESLRRSFSVLPEAALIKALHSAVWMMKNDPPRAVTLWQNQVSPFFAKIWPWNHTWQDMEYQRLLAEACLGAGNSFPAALQQLSPRLKPGGRVGMTLYALAGEKEGGKLCEKFPDDVLRLLSLIITPEHVGYQWTYLKKCLEKISQANPTITELPEYKKLHRIIP